MMMIYQANYKYFLLLALGLLLFFPLSIFGFVEILAGSYFASFSMFLLAFFVLVFVLFYLAKEIVISDIGLICNTQLRTRKIGFSQIKNVKSIYTPKSLLLAGGNKDKATIFYAVTLKDSPLSFVLFGNTITNFQELYVNILEKMNSKHNIYMAFGCQGKNHPIDRKV